MQVEPLEKNAFYQSGLIGFKELNEEDFVQFISIVRDHLDFSDLDTTTNIFVPFLLYDQLFNTVQPFCIYISLDSY